MMGRAEWCCAACCNAQYCAVQSRSNTVVPKAEQCYAVQSRTVLCYVEQEQISSVMWAKLCTRCELSGAPDSRCELSGAPE